MQSVSIGHDEAIGRAAIRIQWGDHCVHLPSLDQAATRPTSANRSSERAAVFIIAGAVNTAGPRGGAEQNGGKEQAGLCFAVAHRGIEDPASCLLVSRTWQDGWIVENEALSCPVRKYRVTKKRSAWDAPPRQPPTWPNGSPSFPSLDYFTKKKRMRGK